MSAAPEPTTEPVAKTIRLTPYVIGLAALGLLLFCSKPTVLARLYYGTALLADGFDAPAAGRVTLLDGALAQDDTFAWAYYERAWAKADMGNGCGAQLDFELAAQLSDNDDFRAEANEAKAKAHCMLPPRPEPVQPMIPIYPTYR